MYVDEDSTWYHLPYHLPYPCFTMPRYRVSCLLWSAFNDMPRQGGFHPANGWFGGGQSLGVRCRGVNLCGVFFFFFFLGGGGVEFRFYIDANSWGAFFLFLLSGLIFHCRPKGLEKSALWKWLLSVCQVAKFQGRLVVVRSWNGVTKNMNSNGLNDYTPVN